MTVTPPIRPAPSALRSNLELITAAVLCLLWVASPEDPARSEDQDQDQDGERNHVPELVRRGGVDAGEQQHRPDRLGHAEDEPTDGGASDAADAPQDRRRERLDAGDEAHERVDLGETQGEQHAGNAGQYPADGEGG